MEGNDNTYNTNQLIMSPFPLIFGSGNVARNEPAAPRGLFGAAQINMVPRQDSAASADSAATAVPTESLASKGDSAEGGPETYWECDDPENPPDWAKGPDGQVTKRPVQCPSRTTVAVAADKTESVVPNDGKHYDPQHRTGTSTYVEATGSKSTTVPEDATAKDPLHRTGTSTVIDATGSKSTAVPEDATAVDPLHRTGTSTFAQATAATSQAAAASADAQKQDEKTTGSAAARKVGVAGVLAAVALSVVNF